MKTACCALVFTLFIPCLGQAQSLPGAGDRVRIRTLDGATHTGEVIAWSDDEIRLFTGSGSPAVVLSGVAVHGFERSLGRHRSTKYFLLPIAAAALTVGTASWVDYPENDYFASRNEAFAYGFLLGGVVGLPLGALIWAAATEERWGSFTALQRAPPRLSVRPLIGRQMGLIVSIQFRRR